MKNNADRLLVTREMLDEASELSGVDGLSEDARQDLFAALQLIGERDAATREENANATVALSREREALLSLEANPIVMSINPHHVRALEGYIANIASLANGKNIGPQMRYTPEGEITTFRNTDEQLAVEIDGAAKVVQAISHEIDEHFAAETRPNPQARAAQDQLLSILGSLLETAQNAGIIGGIGEIRSIRSDVQRRVDARHRQDHFKPHLHKNAWTGTKGAA
jgi:hypothetical protein